MPGFVSPTGMRHTRGASSSDSCLLNQLINALHTRASADDADDADDTESESESAHDADDADGADDAESESECP